MFQRQTRSTFPARTIFVLAAILIAFFYLLLKYGKKDATELPIDEQQQVPQPAPTGVRDNSEEKRGDALSPMEEMMLARAYPDAIPNIRAYKDALRAAQTSVTARGDMQANGISAAWTVQGPGNIGARVNTIKVHPTNPNIIYIGYSAGGVWKTINGGQTWQPIFDAQTELSIGDIELDPQNPQIVYVGTGDLNVSGNVYVGNGLWRSADGGQTWQNLGLENQRIISKIQLHPTNSNIIYVATMGNPFERDNQRGLYKTTDGGQTWQQSFFVDNETGVSSMVMSPTDPATLYASTWPRIRTTQESFLISKQAGVWKSTDAGVSWTRQTNGLPSEKMCRTGLEIDPTNPNRVLAVYVDSTLQFNGIYETVNAGQSWQKLSQNGLDPDFQGGFGWYFGKVYINPFATDDIYVGGVNMWRTLDGGDNWFQTTPDWWLYEVHADMHDMAFINANTVLLATDGGLYKSTDAGNSWTKIENNPCSQFYRVAHNPFQPDIYYGGAQDNGTTAGNSDNINDWPRIYGGDGFQAVFHPTNPDIAYFETQDGNIVTYDVNAGQVYKVLDGIDESDRRNWDVPYFISPNDVETMYTGTFRVYSSVGHPPIWSPISEDLTDGNLLGGRFNTISALDESAVQAGLLYAGTTDGNVWQGNAFTQEWNNISTALPNRYVTSVHASPSTANRVFVTHSGYRSNENTSHIHRSDNKGVTWQSIAGDLPPLAINDVFILPNHADSVLFAATDGGVYITLNAGINWNRLGTGMPYVPVLDLGYNPDQRTLVAGTFARSIMSFPIDSIEFEAPVTTKNPVSNNGQPALAVLPNILISGQAVNFQIGEFDLKSTGKAEICIARQDGQLVWSLPIDAMAQSQSKRDQMPANLTPGVYIAYLQRNGKVWGAQKMIIQR